MKLIFKIITMLWVMSVTGCVEQDKSAEAVDPGILKIQMEALDKAKRVEGMLQESALQQRKTIDENTDNQGQ